ncbi:MAG: hypothetical protein WC875_01510 [Candidatus Absconditabacterales bacterium]
MGTIVDHFKEHHQKYLFGIFGGFAVIKTILVFITGFGVGISTYYYSSFADQESGCVMTGQYYTGEYQECVTTGGYLTGGQEECTTIQEGYYTGGTLDESGNLVDQTYVDPIEDCIFTGQYYTGEYEDCVTTGGYRTGGILSCPDDVGVLSGGDDICGSGDIQWITTLSGSLVRGTIPLQLSYLTDDCVSTPLTIQLWDHNQQWVSIATMSSGATGTTFNSFLLSGITNASGLVTSGFYHVTGSGSYLYTGIATGLYNTFWSGYQMRIVAEQQVLATGGIFTVDNKIPTLTGIQLTSSGAVSGYVHVDDEVQLDFIASEDLVNVVVTIAGATADFHDEDRPLYSYTQTLTSSHNKGKLLYTIRYADAAGNTGLVSGTGTLTFDVTAPVLSGLNVTGTLTGLTLSFVTDELSRSTFQYQRVGNAPIILSGITYQTGHSYLFSGVQANTVYAFRLSIQDVIGNIANYSGSFLINSSGVIDVDYTAIDNGTIGTGDLIVSGSTMKEEITRFNQCKLALTYTPITLTIDRKEYVLQMPEFRKTYVKQIVNAFTLFIMDKVEKKVRLTDADITEITKKFNNFLIILKLIRDDDNSCKQNLSNYHITQFVSVMNEYKIDLK